MANESDIQARLQGIIEELDKLHAGKDSAQADIDHWSQMAQQAAHQLASQGAPPALPAPRPTPAAPGRGDLAPPPEEKEALRHQLLETLTHQLPEKRAEPRLEAQPKTERQWFYTQGNQRLGPVPESELLRLFAQGELSGSTLVWRRPLAEWKKAEETELAELIGPTGPPPLPPAPPPATPIPEAPSPAPVAETVCPSCGHPGLAGERFCAACGHALGTPVKVFCPGCGQQMPETARFCRACGASLVRSAARAAPAPKPKRSRKRSAG